MEWVCSPKKIIKIYTRGRIAIFDLLRPWILTIRKENKRECKLNPVFIEKRISLLQVHYILRI